MTLYVGPKAETTWRDCKMVQCMKKALILSGAIGTSLLLKIFHEKLIAIIGLIGYQALILTFIASVANLKEIRSGNWDLQFLLKSIMAGLLIGFILVVIPIIQSGNIAILLLANISILLLLFAWSYIIQISRRSTINTLDSVLYSIVPKKMVRLLGTELRIVAMSLFIWKTKKSVRDEQFYSSNNLGPIFFTFAFISFIEWFAIHMAIRNLFPNASLISSAVHIFFIMYMIGLAKSLYLRPTLINDTEIDLRLGLMQSETILLSEINKISLGRLDVVDKKHGLDIVLMSNSNVVIETYKKRTIHGLFGTSKDVMFIGFHFDKPIEFVEAVRGKIKTTSALQKDHAVLEKKNVSADHSAELSM